MAARALVIGGVVAYNWWVVVPFVPGLMPSVNGFFSDLEVAGRPYAALMSDADMLAGVLLTAALLLRGAHAQGGPRQEWKWMVAFAIAGGIGGRFPYACSEGLSAACRQMEWHLQLPVHHYVHVVSGIAEFATLTTAAVIAMRRTQTGWRARSPAVRLGGEALLVGYPLLGMVYLTDRLGTLVEPDLLRGLLGDGDGRSVRADRAEARFAANRLGPVSWRHEDRPPDTSHVP